jgi:hypothetical protein
MNNLPDWYGHDAAVDALVGHRVVSVTDDTATLDNGTRIRFQKENSDCCSYVELRQLHAVDHIITAARFEDNSTGMNGYEAWLTVVTESGSCRIAEAEGDATSGYYLDGFALQVTVETP